jgi:hypothetical protein
MTSPRILSLGTGSAAFELEGRDGGVDDAQPGDAAHTQLGVDDIVGLRSQSRAGKGEQTSSDWCDFADRPPPRRAGRHGSPGTVQQDGGAKPPTTGNRCCGSPVPFHQRQR